jgi:hypothetical protein
MHLRTTRSRSPILVTLLVVTALTACGQNVDPARGVHSDSSRTSEVQVDSFQASEVLVTESRQGVDRTSAPAPLSTVARPLSQRAIFGPPWGFMVHRYIPQPE